MDGRRRPVRGPGDALRRRAPLIVRFGSFFLLLLVWEVYARGQSRLILSPLSEVVIALGRLIGTDEFRAAYWETLKPFGIGLALAVAAGVPFGLLIGLSPTFRALAFPYVNLVNAVPMVAFIPFVVMALGIDLTARAAVVFLFALPDIVISSAAGVRYVSADLVEMGRSFQANQALIMRRVVLPGALPGIIAGLRLGAGRAIIGMVAAELLLVSVGMGALITRYRGYFQTANLYAAVLALALTGILVLEIVRRFERRVLHWQLEAGRARDRLG